MKVNIFIRHIIKPQTPKQKVFCTSVAIVTIFACLMAVTYIHGKTTILGARLTYGTSLKYLGEIINEYVDEYNVYPQSDRWCDVLVTEKDCRNYYFRYRYAKEGQGYCAINANIYTANTDIPDDMVLLFEGKGGWNQIGGPEILSTDNHKGKGCYIVFADGNTEFVNTEKLDKLKWIVEENTKQ